MRKLLITLTCVLTIGTALPTTAAQAAPPDAPAVPAKPTADATLAADPPVDCTDLATAAAVLAASLGIEVPPVDQLADAKCRRDCNEKAAKCYAQCKAMAWWYEYTGQYFDEQDCNQSCFYAWVGCHAGCAVRDFVDRLKNWLLG